MEAASLRRTWEDYLAEDEAFEGKLEFYDGEVYAMAGGTPAHAVITANMTGLVWSGLRGKPCMAMSPDQRVALDNDDACYPDVSVVCGEPVYKPRHTLTNPTLLVEVLSPSTATWDRTGKLARYRALTSLRYVVLVAFDEWHLTLFAREDDGTWTWSTANPGESLELPLLGLSLAVDDVYANVERAGGPSRDTRVGPPPDSREGMERRLRELEARARRGELP